MPSARGRLDLEARGYVLLVAKYGCRLGEVDIVVRQGQELVFVEVKTSRGSDFGTPEESITPAKAQQLTVTAQDYLQTQIPPADTANGSWRIDLVSVHLDKSGKLQRISHWENVVED